MTWKRRSPAANRRRRQRIESVARYFQGSYHVGLRGRAFWVRYFRLCASLGSFRGAKP